MAFLRYYAWITVTVILSSNLQRSVSGLDAPLNNGTIGVNYGTVGDNLPPPAQVVAMYRQYKIDKMRIFSPDPTVLNALQDDAKQHKPEECIHVYVGTTNQDLAGLAGSVEFATKWVRTNIVPYPNVCFDYVTAGNEAVPGPYAASVAPAIRNLRLALDGAGFSRIGVSTVVHMAVLGVSYPPSQGAFSAETVQNMIAILKEISIPSQLPNRQKLMINVYPYLAYVSDPVNIKLAYAQFTSTTPVVQDGALPYHNMFDAMIDSFYSAMEKEGFKTVGVTITESGWPSAGNGNLTTPDLARTYNGLLRERIDRGTGTPKRPDQRLGAFLFAMFNENQKPAGVERYWGLFNPDKSPVYPLF